MVINRMTDKKQYLADYSFEYSVDDGKRLTGLFWADGLCKLNYMEFGDVISFDATFKTNRYKMVFVPFTGIDNHCRNPNVVVTDQDPAMKQAIEEVFPISRHILCMWHIMKKVADKVRHELCNNDEFKRRMCDIVWTDSIEPEEFERQWKLVMIEFGLTENKWIDDMFGMRSMWIPAFYRHEPMSGLMRTTSRSESHDIRTCGELKAKQQGKQGKKKMKGVQIEDGVRDKDNEGEDDEEEDDFEDYVSDDGSEEEDQWEEVSGDEDDEDE
ncbi:protein FAR1-RELATED SEQUENCE 2-like [Helianthus annuus]|uniref:protein FAR1-RELATED SEQUENCE 2-like n=1 Tax=Helianthus annuus TaxID=4232 RepID=UPI0016530827|nr:protein FAR1-RELATED SEQUENCE 2-like [Helianthus annuus]